MRENFSLIALIVFILVSLGFLAQQVLTYR